MSAIITDQFRILNANNFIESVGNTSNSYYITVGLANPADAVGFGRATNWDSATPDPTDNFNYVNHAQDTILFGKKLGTSNIRRLIRKVDWKRGTTYEIFRHDYSCLLYTSPSPRD